MDELYFGMLPLRWWYEDQPPVTVWLAWLTTRLGDGIWLQRLPSVVAAAAGAVVAGLFPRVLGAGVRTQRLAAWAHTFTVYPLLMGHLATTSTFDLLAWEVVILLVLRASLGHPRSLAWAGAVAGAACWNKLLILVLVAALVASLLLTDRRWLRTRPAWVGLLLFVALGAPQVVLQLVHGLPMSQVSAGLVEAQGTLIRVVVVPALVLFLGPPLVLVWLNGLIDPWRDSERPGRFLLPTVLLVIAWTIAFPSQPYYPVAAALPALSMGWASPRIRALWDDRTRYRIVASNAAVSCLLCLPVLPAAEPWLSMQSLVNPAIRDQLGWPDYARQVLDQRKDGEDVVVDLYFLAGAMHRYGDAADRAAVFSGHNALWAVGPPTSDRVLLVGPQAVEQADAFGLCEPAGTLHTRTVVHPQLEGLPMLRCSEPVADWTTLWPRFRRLSG